ncbi:acyltransferase [Edaphobacter sp. HDX4]|uniref:acyltransferase family protein n=1 Tax=Edaphobacter sp. HDX4 TaxID=2794064 RepID=UPI002FE5005A
MTEGNPGHSTSTVALLEPVPSHESFELPPPENRLYFPAIDGLRAVAAFLVFLEHYYLYRRSAYLHWGWVGVDIFFVLSGFLITGILYDTRDARHRVRNFYVRRMLRIFPLYYGVFLVVLLLTPFFHWSWSSYWLLWPVYLGNFGHLLSPATRLSSVGDLEHLYSRFPNIFLSFGHFWSLCVEEQFYLIWPFVVFWVRDRKRLLYLCGAVFAAMPFIRLAASFLLPQRWIAVDALYFGTQFRIDALLLGGMLALILRGPAAQAMLGRARQLLVLSLLLLAGAWVTAAVFLHQGFGAGPETPWIRTFGFSLIDLIAAGILLLTLQPGNLLYRLFSQKPLRKMGRISYGFYIFHDLPHALYARMAAALVGSHAVYIPAVTPVLAFFCTLVVAGGSFRYFESLFLNLKDRFTL